MAIFAADSDRFEAEVLNSARPVLVDFWASWCGPCKMLAPVVEAIAEAHPEIDVAKVNVDENPELAMGFQIAAIPTLMLFRNGKSAEKRVGFVTREEIERMLG